MIADGGPIGRRLDFLAQELNRESNTLTAKANDVELTNIGLELKSVVEQFREQVQNLEIVAMSKNQEIKFIEKEEPRSMEIGFYEEKL